MTKPNTDFRVPTIRRAIRLAHAEQLAVDSFDIRPDGSIHVQIRNYEIAPGGEIRAVVDESS